MKATPLGIVTVLFLSFLPFITTTSLFYGAISAKFFAVILFTDVVALFAAYALLVSGARITVRKRWFLWALFLMLAVEYGATFAGVFVERSLWSDIYWMSGVLFLTHVAVLATVFGELLTTRDWTVLRRGIAVSSGVLGLFFLLGKNGLGYTGNFLWLNLGQDSLSLGNETYAGAYLLLAFCLGLIELIRTPRGSTWRPVLILSLALMALSPILINTKVFLGRYAFDQVLAHPALLLGATRASSAALFLLIGFLVGYGVLRRFAPASVRPQALVLWSAAVVVGTSTLVGLLFVSGSVVQNAYSAQSSPARIYVWHSTIDAIGERPLLGWGPENSNFAIESHFDNRLFEDKNFGEIWFERAHNVFIDTAVTVGGVGSLAALLLLGAYLWLVYRARVRGQLGEMEAVVLVAIPFVHLLQMQTAFDTVASYVLLGMIGGYALSLERQTVSGEGAPQEAARVSTMTGAVLVLLAVLSFSAIFVPELRRQSALLTTFTGHTPAEQQAAIDESLGRLSSFESLRLSSSSFIKGALVVLAEKPSPETTKIILSFTDVYEKHYKAYLAEHPEHYRARMNYVYLLLFKTTLGENRVEDARAILKDSYALSPGNPLTYVLGAVAELYGGSLPEADRLMNQALAINPDIEFTQTAVRYFEKQKKAFPNITVLKLQNL